MSGSLEPMTSSPYFTDDELRCKETGELNMSPMLIRRLHNLREMWGQPMIITSGFRSVNHPAEVKKVSAGKNPGIHTYGCAVDVQCSGADAYKILSLAILNGFSGIGFAQKGNHASRFLHLDIRLVAFKEGILKDSIYGSPAIWSY